MKVVIIEKIGRLLIDRIRPLFMNFTIERNSLFIDQVTGIVNGKRILGLGQDIKEVQNAYEAYEILFTLNPYEVNSLFTAHPLVKSCIFHCEFEFIHPFSDGNRNG